MAFGTKTNERPGTRASVRHLHVSAYKAREVLDLIRGKHVADADEGPTMKRWRPRARGRATRIRKRTAHITIIVSRLGERELALRADKAAAPGHTGRRTAARASEARRERVARSRRRDTEKAGLSEDETTDEVVADEADTAVTDEAVTEEEVTDEAAETEAAEVVDEASDAGEGEVGEGEAEAKEDE